MVDLIIEHPYEFLFLLGLWAFGLVFVIHGFSKKQLP